LTGSTCNFFKVSPSDYLDQICFQTMNLKKIFNDFQFFNLTGIRIHGYHLGYEVRSSDIIFGRGLSMQ